MQILLRVKFYDARHAGKALDGPVKFWMQESWSWKAGAGAVKF